MTTEERLAHGYKGRSDWTWHNGELIYSIQQALKESNTLTWNDWTVQSECRNICHYNFEDLDMDDQILCVSYWKALSQLKEDLKPHASSEQLVPVEKVIARLCSFTMQAEQLYGIYPHSGYLVEKFLEGKMFISSDTGLNVPKA